MRDLLHTIQRSDIVQRIDTGTQPPVQTEDLVFDQCGQGEIVKQIRKVFPHACIAVFAQTLVVEAVDLGDLARFVVAAQDGDAVGIADFEGDEEGDGFDGKVAAVDVVTYDCVRSQGLLEDIVGWAYP